MPDYDVIVIGAGPAGVIAAREIAKSGYNILLLDRDQFPGKKKLCGGMISYQGIKEFTFPESIIERKITGIRTILPNKGLREYDFKTVVGINVRRDKLGSYLAETARTAGVVTDFGSTATQVHVSDVVHVKYRKNNSIREVTSKVLVGADGVFSTVAREFGIRNKFDDLHIGITAQREIFMEPELITERFNTFNEFYYGHEFSPFGYGWVFPRKESVVVGVGSLYHDAKKSDRKIIDYLNDIVKHPLISDRLKDGKFGKIKEFFVPLSGPVSPTYGNRFVLVGDAAGHVSPISGEGIHFAMLAGRVAGQVVRESLDNNDFSAKFLSKYEKKWRSLFGSDLKWGRRLMNHFHKKGSKSLGSGFGSDIESVRLIGELLYGIKPVKQVILSALPKYIKWKFSKK